MDRRPARRDDHREQPGLRFRRAVLGGAAVGIASAPCSGGRSAESRSIPATTPPSSPEAQALETEIPRPSALVFDLDGTLVDTVGARIDAWLEALAASGIPAARDQIAPMIGMDGRELARRVAEANGRTLSDGEAEAIDRAAGEAFDRLNQDPRPLPGARELLVALDELRLPWVIATSSRPEQVQRSVAALGLARDPEIADGSQVKRAKPAPDLLILAAKRLDAAPASCWAVGDSTWDVRAAGAAGMAAIGVTAGSAITADELAGSGAALVVDTLDELEKVVRRILS